MMILGISGGKQNGNTDSLVKTALEECKKSGFETEFLNLSKKDIKPCTDCDVCKKGDCPIGDDMGGILRLLAKADGIILGSPTYFGNVSSRVSLMFERSLPLRRQGFKLRNKVGGAIAVGGSRNGGQEFVVRAIQNWFTLHGMIVVADDAPTAHFGGIAVGRKTGDAARDETGLETVRNLGKRVAEVVSLKK
jgi:multimeric flavodoxin WrbA